MPIASELCRLAIRAADGEVDVIFPAHVPVGDLLPAAFDLIIDAGPVAHDLAGRRLALAVPGCEPLDNRRSLADNGIHDGTLLVIVPIVERPTHRRFNTPMSVREDIRAAASAWPSTAALLFVAGWLFTLVAGLLLWILVHPRMPEHLPVGIGCSGVAIALAILAQRRLLAAPAICLAGIAAVSLTSIASALALPGGLGTAHLMLAMATCSLGSMTMSRLLRCGTRVLTALAGTSAVMWLAALGAVLSWWSTHAVGPILMLSASVLLVAAPRVALYTSNLSSVGSLDGDIRGLGVTTHHRLTDLIMVAGMLTAAGSLLAAVCGPPTPATTVAGALASANLALLAHRHSDPRRVMTLQVTAAVSTSAVAWSIACAYPADAPWLCVIAPVAVGIAHSLHRVPQRIVRACEHAVTVAAIPMTCWAAGLFSAARGLSFP